jgi:transglutaminase-like putative cysteine protease
MALLFITLCRCAGVPARWESGWKAEPGFCGAHDWTQFYAAPYGWLYADPSFGAGAAREGNETRRTFYFGNLDCYRMSSNTAFQSDFDVPMKHWRADPYDNQVGEMELSSRGLRYEEFERTKEVLEFTEL